MNRIPDHLVDEVRASLRQRIEDVFESCGAELRGRGRNRRTSLCPSCGTRSRWDAVRLSVERGWVCACCRASGDAVKALALFAGLDPRRDFAEVIRRGADVAGIVLEEADPAEAARRKAEYARRRHQREQERLAREAAEAQERAEAIDKARRGWPLLAERSARGEAYLASRGIDAVLLHSQGVVRYGQRSGDPGVALYGEDGALCNVVRRVIEPGDGPKTPGLLHCPTSGTLVGTVADIEQGQTSVVVEGVIDALTACCAWPGATVLGAHGVGNYADVVRMAAERLVQLGGRCELLLCFDADEPGQQAVGESLEAIGEAGLDLAFVRAVDLGGHHDLNDAWCAGWRP